MSQQKPGNPGGPGGPAAALPGTAGAALLTIGGVTAGLPGRPFGTVPVLPALADLLPGRGLARGTVVSAGEPGMLCQALLAGASQSGAWCGVAGLPQFGVVAAAEAGADPDRMILVPEPGTRWAEVAAVLLDACDVVLIRCPDYVAQPVRRRVETAARSSGAVLVVAGPWDGAALRLRVVHRKWEGIGDGYGRLRACRVQVAVTGRGVATREHRSWLWLPGPGGKVTAAAPAPAQDAGVSTSAEIG